MDLFVQVATKIPDVEQLLALEPEELTARILFLWQSSSPNQFAEPNTFDPARRMNTYDVPYPRDSWPEVGLAFSEAFSWLLVNSPGHCGSLHQTSALAATEQTRAQNQDGIGFFQLQDRSSPSSGNTAP
jgi:hypothetical protein